MDDDKTLEALTAAIRPETEPIRKIAPPWRRALVLVPYALVAVAVLTLSRGVRSDAALLGPWFLFGVSAVQLAASYALFRIVLRETIPGSSSRPWAWTAAAGLVVLVQLASSEWTAIRSPYPMAAGRELSVGAACLGFMSVIGVPVLLFGMIYASRGIPLRPRLTGLSLGLVGGLAAEAIYRTHCPYSHLGHMVAWHTGAVVFLALVGFFAGTVWELQRVERWRQRRGR